LLRQHVQYIWANCLFELWWRDLFIGTGSHPRIRGVAVATLLEAVDEFAKPSTKKAAGAGATETTPQLSEQAVQPALSFSAWGILRSTKHLGDFVPVLISRNCHKT
jgi:hypothetical protein